MTALKRKQVTGLVYRSASSCKSPGWKVCNRKLCWRVWQPLVALLRQGKTLTLLYGSKDTEHNQGMVLREFLLAQL